MQRMRREQLRTKHGQFTWRATVPDVNKKLPPMILSEYGICGAQGYTRFLRHLEQLGKEHAPDAVLDREKMRLFDADWKRRQLDECWARRLSGLSSHRICR
jgi:hypothetical protein